MGPLWIDLEGYELSKIEAELLRHPTVGGVILFARNYHDSAQLCALTSSIRQAAGRPILIGVDQEGGRVQRFIKDFTKIPAAPAYHKLPLSIPAQIELAKDAGWLMATELGAHGVDISFAPVLDVGIDCDILADRVFGPDISTVINLSSAFIAGMRDAGMSATGKHFPGHGGVKEDTHKLVVHDASDDIIETHMQVFKYHIQQNNLAAIMPAHVIYPVYDPDPASGSAYWLQTVLRQHLNFKGIIFSDDLAMEGAKVMGSALERAQHALSAGCDMILMCNDRQAVIEILDGLTSSTLDQAESLLFRSPYRLTDLIESNRFNETRQKLESIIINYEVC